MSLAKLREKKKDDTRTLGQPTMMCCVQSPTPASSLPLPFPHPYTTTTSTNCGIFSDSVQLDVESSPRWPTAVCCPWLVVAGTPGVWLSGVLPLQFGAPTERVWTNTCVKSSVQTTTTTNPQPNPTQPRTVILRTPHAMAVSCTTPLITQLWIVIRGTLDVNGKTARTRSIGADMSFFTRFFFKASFDTCFFCVGQDGLEDVSACSLCF